MRIFPQILFALMLLLSQTASASHDVEHLGAAHNDLCAVYLSQDNSDIDVTAVTALISSIAPANADSDLVDLLIIDLRLIYASRAPPMFNFYS